MQKIGLLSDTHSWIYPGIFNFFENCDEIWHAGDIGNEETLNTLENFKPLRAVHGNIDGYDIRIRCPETNIFHCENLKVMIRHIGGYPGRYDRNVVGLLDNEKPGLFISGHSHILKVIYDDKKKLLHLNPGAAGRSGLHRMITCMRFNIHGDKISKLEILEKARNAI